MDPINSGRGTANPGADPPSPAPGNIVSEYPRIVFQPDLHNMRHHKLQQLVYSHAKAAQTLLDIGCGDCSLVQRFICDYEGALHKCPLQRVNGIDIDDANFRPETGVLDSIDDALHNERWTPMAVHIMKGSFEVLEGCGEELWDVVLACEVVEHLDPQPLAAFPRIVLGDMKPDIFIVTTPDRRFNQIFDILSGFQPEEISAGQRYQWPGVDYEMRHPDHRFEWTASEFQSWANTQATTYGYSVAFDGVGGFGSDSFHSAYLCGMDIPEQRTWFFDKLKADGLSDACCTQIAIFKRNLIAAQQPPRPPVMELPSRFTPFFVYQCHEAGNTFLPSPKTVWRELAGSDFIEFLSTEYHEAWINFRNPYAVDGELSGGISSNWTARLTYEELFERGSRQLKWMCHDDVNVFKQIAIDTWKNADLGWHENFRPQIFDVWTSFGDEGITLEYQFSPSGAVWWEGVESPPPIPSDPGDGYSEHGECDDEVTVNEATCPRRNGESQRESRLDWECSMEEQVLEVCGPEDVGWGDNVATV